MSQQIPISGDRNAIIQEKTEIQNIKAIINNISNKTEAEINTIINNNFTGLSTQDKAILKEMALCERAIAKALKYIWTIMK